MVKEFTKSILQNGMVVETRDGVKFLVNGNILVGKGVDFDELESYNEDLTITDCKDGECDIVKIYTTNSYYIEHLFDDDNLTLVWERKEENPMETKDYTIKQNEYDDISVPFFTEKTIKIEPNNCKGYSKADSNIPIWIFSEKNDNGFGLTIDSAKEMIKDLQEIVDYMDK